MSEPTPPATATPPTPPTPPGGRRRRRRRRQRDTTLTTDDDAQREDSVRAPRQRARLSSGSRCTVRAPASAGPACAPADVWWTTATDIRCPAWRRRTPGGRARAHHRRGVGHRPRLRGAAGRGRRARSSSSTGTPRRRETVAAEVGGTAVAVDLSDLDGGRRASTSPSTSWSTTPASSTWRRSTSSRSTGSRYILRLMVEAPFRLVRGALPHMYERGWGRIVNISSVHGLRASAYKSAYVTAKHGLEGLSKVIALEGAEHGVTSNCVNPAYVRTPLVEGQIADQARTHGCREDEVVEQVMLAPAADQAADRARRGGRGGGVPVLAGRRVDHRQLAGHGRRLERPLTARAGPRRRRRRRGRVLLAPARGRRGGRVRAAAAGGPRGRARTAARWPSWSGSSCSPCRCAGARRPPAARGGAVRAVRHRRRPGRAARPRRRARGDRPPGPAAARHRRLLPDPATTTAAATPTCG